MLFWSEWHKRWESPQEKASDRPPNAPAATQLTTYPCPVCQQPLEEYGYTKDGQSKRLLRCSALKGKAGDRSSLQQRKHKDVVYFQTAKGWWSPKFGELSDQDKEVSD